MICAASILPLRAVRRITGWSGAVWDAAFPEARRTRWKEAFPAAEVAHRLRNLQDFM